ncbi:glycosyl transferase family 2 [Salipiger aestuarii]|uniref:Glycosyltransferase involved in cell wall biosynthesis n=1 Tax=Salipiger aestuarii TaxID=568098 RepID=A0A327XY12_9RHOB|nr:glycosyl transferase family 2 [Salipiger aestuarii]EIE48636.1 glycosyl transferase family 2 [Citreicella sp. 357]KAA8606553.1 glycosyl transferase family 2 [Salipiger aestuarii]KAA8610052.1 glycosyl transferase family 2 [Salipiger aestuarii]KAB2541220.1 glycosyl transferase family 2 [Salipiger aestuarii]RAK13878.1 glycosyltransferase involved in cell wall biosynthesis [Salipiger aestuarii]
MTIGGSLNTHTPGLLSVIVAAEAMQELPDTLVAVRPELDAMGRPYEVICITDGRDDTVMAALNLIGDDWPELLVLGQRPWRGDDAALSVAMRRVRGNPVLTLAGWPEVAPEDLARLPDMLGDADMVTVSRSNRPQSRWQAWRRRHLTRMLARLFGQSPADPFCRTRLARRAVLDDVTGFGVRQHFIPVIAGQRGYKLTEVELRGVSNEGHANARYVFRPMGHFVALLDAITLYVVLNFLRRPLRFFGAIGMPIFIFGALATAVLIGQRLLGDALADRPALIFAVLMVVLGVQIVAIGLVGEIIIFANSRRLRQYAVREIITGADRSVCGMPAASNVIAPLAASNDG